METSDELPFLAIYTRAEWRSWLEKYHQSEQSVWIVSNTKKSGQPAVAWSELVDEALCFGWIDSTRKTIDENSFRQLFSKRKRNGTWSKINKEKVKRLEEDKLMRDAGYEAIRIAKENGSWTILDSVEELEIPHDLAETFKSHPNSEEYFLGLSKSVRKMLLQWITLAKRPETRMKRITEIAEHAALNEKPKQFR
ncbi:hypothetical protein EG347_07165 [Chryseobacterium sp. G0186]|uniref:YdeI/OmpD-associated family protein n=1 Tax=Chryseobacterium sp. G0186 TaxID=2487064 RepID=UPI000F51290B|nr:YdeI/OmpD-associated family protein [Chryseobacterium sp. G0186]AZA77300.1 hypothetical protein EG347_07165 [Chryseobacterium sp. G0186]